MVGTIIPIVYGAGFRKAYGVVVAHSLGLLAGAAALGVALWLAYSTVFASASLVTVAALVPLGAAAYGLHHLGLIRLPIPSLDKQVPARWRASRRPRLVAFVYGLGLGVGILTHVRTATFYFACLMAIMVGDAFLAAGVMAAYGLGRLVPLASFALIAESPRSAYSLNDAVLRHRRSIEYANALVLFGTAGWSAFWLLPSLRGEAARLQSGESGRRDASP